MADLVKSMERIAAGPWRAVVAVLAAAFVTASIASTIAGQWLIGSGTRPAGAAGRGEQGSFAVPGPIASLNQSAVDQILKRNIFNSEGAATDEAAPAEDGKPLTTEVVKSDLPVKLLGTIYGGDPLSGIALVENTQKKTTNSFLVGDALTKEATVKEVHKERIIIDRSGRLEYIEVERQELARSRRKKKGGGSATPSPAATIAPIATEPPPSTFREEGFERDKTNIQMTSAYKNKLLSTDITKVLQDAKASPHMVDGELRGFVLTRIRKDSIYEKAGLQNDDIVEEINGVPLTDTSQAIKLLQSLKNENEIDVRVNRAGSAMRFNLSVR
jgi:general secretion pathway protein C